MLKYMRCDMEKRTTIKDVAKLLNMSVSTVSRVANGRDRVSSDTRKKVMDAIKKLNYVPDYAAVSIVKKQSRVILVMVPDLDTPFFLKVVQGVEETASREGYFTMIFSSNCNRDEEYNLLNGMMGRSADGIIVIPSAPDFSYFQAVEKPIVFVDRYNDDYVFDCVVIDNFRGAYIAVEHLIEMGHEKIGVLSGPKDLNIGKERYWGYSQAMQDHNIKLVDDYISLIGWDEADGYNGVCRMLKASDPPTAFFAANENNCRGAIKALKDLNIKDVSLIGFDDNELARFVDPPVTVVNRATSEMGRIGVTMLLDKIRNPRLEATPQRISLPTNLIVRGSVRKIK